MCNTQKGITLERCDVAMELLKAIELLEKKKVDLEALEKWIDSLEFTKPICGEHWDKILQNIESVSIELQEEIEQLEQEINSVAGSIKINWTN